jgi:peroxiredoxin Q/BCP
MPDVSVGQPAPDFSLPDTAGNTVRLSDFRGRKVVLYFYPKDDTPGCTREACDFRDAKAQFDAAGAVILGVSADDGASHGKFAGKYNLPFTLLSDRDHRVAELYGVWKGKSLAGMLGFGIERSTFLIDEQGNLVNEFRKVKVDGHVDVVLNLML